MDIVSRSAFRVHQPIPIIGQNDVEFYLQRRLIHPRPIGPPRPFLATTSEGRPPAARCKLECAISFFESSSRSTWVRLVLSSADPSCSWRFSFSSSSQRAATRPLPWPPVPAPLQDALLLKKILDARTHVLLLHRLREKSAGSVATSTLARPCTLHLHPSPSPAPFNGSVPNPCEICGASVAIPSRPGTIWNVTLTHKSPPSKNARLQI
jgi:hypothetical protein